MFGVAITCHSFSLFCICSSAVQRAKTCGVGTIDSCSSDFIGRKLQVETGIAKKGRPKAFQTEKTLALPATHGLQSCWEEAGRDESLDCKSSPVLNPHKIWMSATPISEMGTISSQKYKVKVTLSFYSYLQISSIPWLKKCKLLEAMHGQA